MQAIKNKKAKKRENVNDYRYIGREEDKFFSKITSVIKKFKSYVIESRTIAESKNERAEIKNFNRNFNAKKADINVNARMFMFSK